MAGITPNFYSTTLGSQGYFPSATQAGSNYAQIVNRNFLPGMIYESVYKSTPFLKYLLSKHSKPIQGSSMSPITQTVSFNPFASSLSWTDMTGTFNAPVLSNPAQTLQFLPSLAIASIGYSMVELSQFATHAPELAVDIIEQRLRSTIENSMQSLNTTAFGSQGTNVLQMQGLNDIIDNGTNQSYYGGLSRTTYPALSSKIYTNTNTTTSAYQLLFTYIMSFLKDTNYKTPTLAVCSPDVFTQVATSFTNFERMVIQDINTLPAEGREWAVNTVSVMGVPLIVDPTLNGSSTVYFINMDDLIFYYDKYLCFKLSEPESTLPLMQAAYVQIYSIAGQLVSFQPQSHFAITNFPTASLV